MVADTRNPPEPPARALRSARVTSPAKLRVAPSPTGDQRRPPHDLDAEEAILGAGLLSSDGLSEAIQHVRPEDFWDTRNQAIFECLVGMHLDNAPIDCLTVADALSRRGQLVDIGGADRLLALETATPTLTHSARYARIVADHAMMRRLGAAGTEITQLAHSRPEDPDAAADAAEAIVLGVAQRRITDSTVVLHELIGDTLDRLERLYEGGPPTRCKTGFADLDRVLSGIAPASLVVVGARPAMGKTAFALSIAANMARDAQNVIVFSLEMSREEISERLMAADARVDTSRMRNGELEAEDWRRITLAAGRLGSAPIWVDDNPGLTVTEIRAKARRLHQRQGGLGLIVVDYLQLLSGRADAENRQVEVAEMSRSLKLLARELNTPVLALSQLSRNLEQRADKRPMLADLRESGSIEQDADVVMFIYRDEIYRPDTPDRGMAEIIVSKHRNGPTGTARLAWLPSYTMFADMAHHD